MKKPQTQINSALYVFLAIAWFLVITWATAQTQYHELIADRLADPSGTSTHLEDILKILIVAISLIPSGLLLAFPYVKKNFKDYTVLRTTLLAILIAILLIVPFSWYNFTVNFAR